MKPLLQQRHERGVTLIEVLLAVSLILAATLALLGVHSLYLRTALSTGEEVKAAYLAEEGIEAARYLRAYSWNGQVVTLAPGTPYGVFINGSLWQTSATNTMIGTFKRTITISSAYRNASNNLVSATSAGAVLDSGTVLVTSSVAYPAAGATTTKSIAAYLINLYGN